MCISYNNMNNNWMNLFQQGLGMLGINNTFGSFGSFNPMSMNGSLFNYNVNYDAMAGMAVANAVLGVTGQAISSSRAEKQAEKQEYKNSSARLKEIDNDIQNQEKISDAKGEEISKQEGIIKNAKNEIETLNKHKKSEADIQNLKTAWDTEYKKDPNSPATANAKEAYDKAVSENKEIDKKIKAQEDIKKEAEAKIETLKKEKDAADSKIKDLKAEKEELQKEVDSYDLDAANGTKLSRTSDKEYEKLLDNDGNAMKNQRYSKADVKTAVDRFMQAVDDDKKMQAAKNLVEMFENCPDWTESLQKAAKVAQRYINEHENEA